MPSKFPYLPTPNPSPPTSPSNNCQAKTTKKIGTKQPQPTTTTPNTAKSEKKNPYHGGKKNKSGRRQLRRSSDSGRRNRRRRPAMGSGNADPNKPGNRHGRSLSSERRKRKRRAAEVEEREMRNRRDRNWGPLFPPFSFYKRVLTCQRPGPTSARF